MLLSLSDILFIPRTSAEANTWLTNKQLKLPAKQKDVGR